MIQSFFIAKKREMERFQRENDEICDSAVITFCMIPKQNRFLLQQTMMQNDDVEKFAKFAENV